MCLGTVIHQIAVENCCSVFPLGVNTAEPSMDQLRILGRTTRVSILTLHGHQTVRMGMQCLTTLS